MRASYASTVMPMERAVPAMISDAASRSLALRSASFDLRDLANLVAGELRNLDGVRSTGALGDAGGLLDELSCRRGLQDERERTVFVHGDLDGDDVAALVFRRRVVRLAELHDVHAVLTQRRPDGRCGVGGAGLDLKLNQTRDLLLRCHFFSSLSCRPRAALPLQGFSLRR